MNCKVIWSVPFREHTPVKKHNRFKLEALEQRILLSADPLLGAALVSPAGGDAPEPAEATAPVNIVVTGQRGLSP